MNSAVIALYTISIMLLNDDSNVIVVRNDQFVPGQSYSVQENMPAVCKKTKRQDQGSFLNHSSKSAKIRRHCK